MSKPTLTVMGMDEFHDGFSPETLQGCWELAADEAVKCARKVSGAVA